MFQMYNSYVNMRTSVMKAKGKEWKGIFASASWKDTFRIHFVLFSALSWTVTSVHKWVFHDFFIGQGIYQLWLRAAWNNQNLWPLSSWCRTKKTVMCLRHCSWDMMSFSEEKLNISWKIVTLKQQNENSNQYILHITPMNWTG